MDLATRLQELNLDSEALQSHEVPQEATLPEDTMDVDSLNLDSLSLGPHTSSGGHKGGQVRAVNFPRNLLFTFGGLPVLSCTASQYALRLFAAAKDCAPKPADCEGSDDLEVGLDDPASVAWWVEFYKDEPRGDVYWEPCLDPLQELFAQVPTREMRALMVGGKVRTGWEVRAALYYLVLRADVLPGLRSLFLGEIVDDGRLCDSAPLDLAPLLHTFPDLEELRICNPGAAYFTTATVHRRLRRLAVYDNFLNPNTLISLSTCSLPALEQLDLWVSGEAPLVDGCRESHALLRLLSARGMPALARLGLQNLTFSDDILKTVAVSSAMPQLRCLDLSWSLVTADGLGAILERLEDRSRPVDLEEVIVSRAMVVDGQSADICRDFGLMGVVVTFV